MRRYTVYLSGRVGLQTGGIVAEPAVPGRCRRYEAQRAGIPGLKLGSGKPAAVSHASRVASHSAEADRDAACPRLIGSLLLRLVRRRRDGL